MPGPPTSLRKPKRQISRHVSVKMKPEERLQLNKSHSLKSNCITVKVGSGDKAYVFGVHENLICEPSSFFRAALNGTWKELVDQIVDLPDDDPEVFELYINRTLSLARRRAVGKKMIQNM